MVKVWKVLIGGFTTAMGFLELYEARAVSVVAGFLLVAYGLLTLDIGFDEMEEKP